MAEENDVIYEGDDRRAEPRSIDEQYSSVEFSLKDLTYLYQFKIWDTSQSGISILVKEGSEVLEHLQIGDVLDMKYYPKELSDEPVRLKTEIRHITGDVPERIKGHYMVGLSVCEKQEDNP